MAVHLSLTAKSLAVVYLIFQSIPNVITLPTGHTGLLYVGLPTTLWHRLHLIHYNYPEVSAPPPGATGPYLPTYDWAVDSIQGFCSMKNGKRHHCCQLVQCVHYAGRKET